MKNEVKLGLASVAALAAGSTAASAGSGGYEWSGPYAGISAGMLFGDIAYASTSDDYKLKGNFTPGMFAGYNWESHSGTVIGIELAGEFPMLGTSNTSTSYPNSYGYSYLVDGKVKFGKAFGQDDRVLLYGFGGGTIGSAKNYESEQDYSVYGVNYGIGLDYAVSERLRLGIEATGRTVNGYYDQTAHNRWYTFGEVAVRASFNF